jgi:hypothetical protein
MGWIAGWMQSYAKEEHLLKRTSPTGAAQCLSVSRSKQGGDRATDLPFNRSPPASNPASSPLVQRLLTRPQPPPGLPGERRQRTERHVEIRQMETQRTCRGTHCLQVLDTQRNQSYDISPYMPLCERRYSIYSERMAQRMDTGLIQRELLHKLFTNGFSF